MDASRETVYVLTRTSNRPKAFARCRESFFIQEYPGPLYHVISSDESSDDYPEGDIIVKVERSHGEFPANLYMNQMMAQVGDGWYICLDDDDVFTEPTSVRQIIGAAPDYDSTVIFKVDVDGSWIIPAYDWGGNVHCGNITGQCVAFHSTHRQHAVWQNRTFGDCLMIKSLLEKTHPVWLDSTLIRFQNKHGNGQRRDIE